MWWKTTTAAAAAAAAAALINHLPWQNVLCVWDWCAVECFSFALAVRSITTTVTFVTALSPNVCDVDFFITFLFVVYACRVRADSLAFIFILIRICLKWYRGIDIFCRFFASPWLDFIFLARHNLDVCHHATRVCTHDEYMDVICERRKKMINEPHKVNFKGN